MKILLLIFVLVIRIFHAQAQFVVIDPGDIAATIANGGILVATNEVIKDANDIASNISQTVNNIRDLQQNIDRALYEVKALIRGDELGISNIAFEIDATARIKVDLAPYLEGILPEDHPLIVGYSNADISLGAQALQETFEYGFQDVLPTTAEQLSAQQGEKVANREIYGYAAARKKIQIALTYNQLADVMIAKAEQLNKVLGRGLDDLSYGEDDVLKMNEAERIQLFETSASYVRKALELRLDCDQLIQQEVTRVRPVQEKSLQLYSQFLRFQQYYEKDKDKKE